MQQVSASVRTSALWIAAAVLLSLCVSLAFPPAFWICGVGAAILGGSLLAKGRRTGQHDWLPGRQNDESLTPTERRWMLVAMVLIAVPLAVALVRALIS
jgi:hypothetical protein